MVDIDPKIMKTLEVKVAKKRKGRPLEFSDQLILMLLIVKIHYKMPYRMLEGFARFFFEQLKKIKVPTYSLTCKRARGLTMGLILPLVVLYEKKRASLEFDSRMDGKAHISSL